jgi:hypothetical protein
MYWTIFRCQTQYNVITQKWQHDTFLVYLGDVQPKGSCQRELVNLDGLLRYQNHQWKCQNANASKKKKKEESAEVISNKIRVLNKNYKIITEIKKHFIIAISKYGLKVH